MLVPFYRVEWVTGGGDVRRYHSVEAAWRRAFATHLVLRGVTVVAVPWWFESLVDDTCDEVTDGSGGGLAARYAPAVAEHRRRHTCTGLGRSTADLIAVLDALDDLRGRSGQPSYGCFGHSLGAKLTLFLAALDDRVGAAVMSEPGIGWASSNWSAPWYVGDQLPTERDHDEVLALLPPRRAMLVAGGDSDGNHNAHLVAAARERAGSVGDRLEVLRHDEGHTPPWPVLDRAYDWLLDRLAETCRRR